MRIGIFTETYPPFINGVSTSIVVLQRALEKQGHTVFIITVNTSKLKYEYDKENKILRVPSLSLHVYDYRFTSLYPIKAMKYIKEMKLDVIHTHIELTVGIFARFVSTQLSIPLVHTYHTKWEDYTHYVTHGNKYLDKVSKEIVKYLSNLLTDKAVTELIVPTRKIYNLFKDKYKLEKNIHIVPTGIEIDKFSQKNFSNKKISELKKKLNINKNDFVIITVSRLAKEKSVDVIIKNQAKINEMYNNIKLLIVGDGPDKQYLNDLSKKLKIEDKVIFTGKIPLEEIAIYYQLADLFVTASTTETQGLTVVEAISSSLPVVAIRDESFIDSVIPNLNGYLYDTDIEYINYVCEIYKKADLREKFANESRLLSKSMSSTQFAENVLDVYKEAIKNYKRQRKINNIITKK